MIHALSPAKLNLFLHIVGRRANGYHELQSIFQLIDLYDELIFTPQNHADITLTGSDFVDVEHNLIYKAAQCLKPYAQAYTGVNIHLNKNIPMGAGLGGGSSNAATTLIVLNQLWQCQCSNEQLQHLALNLGADVPFFILGKNAWVEGIGEHLTAIDLPEKHYFVIKPDCFISTQHLFSQKSLTRDTKITKFSDYQIQPNLFRNNFEAVAIELYPEVKRAIDHLNQIGQARLTGTGSCIFVEIDDKIDYSDFLKQSPYPIYKVKSLAQSPLVDFKLDD